jgi:hypothetical protein
LQPGPELGGLLDIMMDQEDVRNSFSTTSEKEQDQQLSKSKGSAGSETDDNIEDDEDSPNETDH